MDGHTVCVAVFFVLGNIVSYTIKTLRVQMCTFVLGIRRKTVDKKQFSVIIEKELLFSPLTVTCKSPFKIAFGDGVS